MIAVKAEHDRLQVTIPTAGMTPGEVNDFVSWLRVESVVRRSRDVDAKDAPFILKTALAINRKERIERDL
jgi:hypothetical protein